MIATIVLALSGCSDAGARDVSSTASTAPAQPSADAVKPSASDDGVPRARQKEATKRLLFLVV
jgi:hypothetical protein